MDTKRITYKVDGVDLELETLPARIVKQIRVDWCTYQLPDGWIPVGWIAGDALYKGSPAVLLGRSPSGELRLFAMLKGECKHTQIFVT